jgi:hypothetical protein
MYSAALLLHKIVGLLTQPHHSTHGLTTACSDHSAAASVDSGPGSITPAAGAAVELNLCSITYPQLQGYQQNSHQCLFNVYDQLHGSLADSTTFLFLAQDRVDTIIVDKVNNIVRTCSDLRSAVLLAAQMSDSCCCDIRLQELQRCRTPL